MPRYNFSLLRDDMASLRDLERREIVRQRARIAHLQVVAVEIGIGLQPLEEGEGPRDVLGLAGDLQLALVVALEKRQVQLVGRNRRLYFLEQLQREILVVDHR